MTSYTLKTSELHDNINSLLAAWDKRRLGALPVDAMLINRHIRELREIVSQPVQPVAPDGWHLVPIEPTQAMLVAGVTEQHGRAVYRAVAAQGCSTYEGEQYLNYAAMLAAAPTPPFMQIPKPKD